MEPQLAEEAVMTELDHLHIELTGRNLIEASAGTGKTYAIVCLYLRLLVERELTPEEILVVTYTEAATEELRGRIRRRIREALAVFSGMSTDDAFLRELAGNLNGRGPEREKGRESLARALTSFDTAAIHTIHGFCLRALQDNAFESGSLYDTELVTDQEELLREIVDDFWRTRFFADPAPLLPYALQHGFSPDYFLKFLRGMVANPKVEIVPRFDAGEITAVEEGCRIAFEKVRQGWEEKREEIVGIITADKGLSRAADSYRADLLPALFAAMDAYTAAGNPFDLFGGFGKFTTSGLLKGKKPTGTPLSHPFFSLCEELVQMAGERFLALRWELVAFAAQRLPARKKERNVRFFDDLLADLYGALHGATGTGLAARLRDRYRAALIDEFQDTDPVQYAIFRKIYGGEDHPLFLIGDPKQAIYSFRGADIFAYLEAAADVGAGNRFTLTGNWRSTPRLLSAFNTLFGSGSRPFVFDEIAYHQVRPGKSDPERQLVVADGDDAPLQVWYLPPDEGGAPVKVGQANETVPAAVAAEIARLLRDGGGCIGGRPLQPPDIAVIVRTHRQAGQVQDALRKAGIPSVMRSDTSIFATDEAREVLTLLGALADPGNETKVRTALVTDLLGRSGDDIARLLEDEAAWEECLETFRGYHQAWLERGIMMMSRSLLAGEGVRGQLLRRPDGERRLTNVLHCFEIIHRAAHEKGLGIEGLLTWFGERVSGKTAAEEYQIRLETDEKAVRIVTVHVSKGLEYPVVFCPFMWGGLGSNDEVATFHDGFTMVKDFGSPDHDRHRLLAQRETLAESLRLLYVALTRAKYRCYLVAGKIADSTGKNRPETSPLAYLFHCSDAARSAEDLVPRLAGEVSPLSAADMERELRTLAGKDPAGISVTGMPAAAAGVPLPAPADDLQPLASRKFSGKIGSDWRVASFTSFAAHEGATGELPDRDAAGSEERGETAPSEEIPATMSIFTFPKGAQAGIFLHGLFEELDFAGLTPDHVRGVVERGLAKAGYDPEWLPPVASMVNHVTSAPLRAPEGTFSLAGLAAGSWVTELEFFFPLRFISSPLLQECLRKWGKDAAVDLDRVATALRFRPVEGIVRGFMDMVFRQGGRYYLVDWKSNHLGYRPEDYGRDHLREEMERRLYPLQYLLYTVALNRFLCQRVPGYDYGTHFGGVAYIFLRGVRAERGEEFGIFRDIPPAELIGGLTECLIKAGG